MPCVSSNTTKPVVLPLELGVGDVGQIDRRSSSPGLKLFEAQAGEDEAGMG